jgi:2'-5' RNA ligase
MRAFFAIDIPESFRTELGTLITDMQAQYTKSINWVKPENLHFTLQFIGDMHIHQMKELTDFVQKELQDKSVILMKNPKLSLFPTKNPHIIWIEMTPHQNWVLQFVKRLRNYLQDLGYEIDKKKIFFHITLGRIKGNLPDYFIEYILQKGVSRISIKVNTIALYKSTLHPEGPNYEAISKFILEDTYEK